MIGLVAGAADGLLHAIFAVACAPTRSSPARRSTSSRSASRATCSSKIYGDQGTPDDLPAIPDVHLPIGWIRSSAMRSSSSTCGLARADPVALRPLFLFRTAQGLRMRSVGENPFAADTAGIPPIRVRYQAVIAVRRVRRAGRRVPLDRVRPLVHPSLIAGRGFIGLAAVIFGKWRPGGALAAAMLFGFASALAPAAARLLALNGDPLPGAALTCSR